MQKKQLKPIPAGGPKTAKAGKRSQDKAGSPPTAEDAGETEQETHARESERALGRALGRVPPG